MLDITSKEASIISDHSSEKAHKVQSTTKEHGLGTSLDSRVQCQPREELKAQRRAFHGSIMSDFLYDPYSISGVPASPPDSGGSLQVRQVMSWMQMLGASLAAGPSGDGTREEDEKERKAPQRVRSLALAELAACG